MITNHRYIFSPSSDMHHIDSETVDLIVTSPPYPMIQMWDSMFCEQNQKIEKALSDQKPARAFELMHQGLDEIWRESFRVLKKGGFACINIGDAVRTINSEFAIYPNHSRIISVMSLLGFTCLPSVIWRKQTNAPNKFMGSGMLPAGAYVTLEHEYILIFRKGGKRPFINQSDKNKRHESAMFWEERNSWFSDIWIDLKGSRQSLIQKDVRKRSAAYPMELPYRLINMYSVKEDTVLDPFAGIGTTSLAAMCLGRNSINYEIEGNFKNLIHDRILNLPEHSESLVESRLDHHNTVMNTRLKEGKPVKHYHDRYGFPVVTAQEKKLLFERLISIEEENPDWYVARYHSDQSEYQQAGSFNKETREIIKKQTKEKQLTLFD